MDSQKALFAAGCFWGVQYYFDQIPGVVKTTVGYTGGNTKNPTYDEIHSRPTGHAESVLVEFNPKRVNYETLLKHFFRIHNPTLVNSDGINVGDMYRSAIFYFNAQQETAAKQAISEVQKRYTEPIVTQLAKAGEFYVAEAYHQKFTERTGYGMCHVPYQSV